MNNPDLVQPGDRARAALEAHLPHGELVVGSWPNVPETTRDDAGRFRLRTDETIYLLERDGSSVARIRTTDDGSEELAVFVNRSMVVLATVGGDVE